MPFPSMGAKFIAGSPDKNADSRGREGSIAIRRVRNNLYKEHVVCNSEAQEIGLLSRLKVGKLHSGLINDQLV